MPFLDQGSRHALLINAVCGLMVGYAIGYASVCLEYQSYASNCTRYTGEAACNALTHSAGCEWTLVNASRPAVGSPTPTRHACTFSDRRDSVCSVWNTSGACSAAGRGCYFDHSAARCEHVAGWTPVEQGLFASMLIVGAFLGSSTAATLLNKLGRRYTIGLIGLLSIAATLLLGLGWSTNHFALLTVSRAVVGLTLGLASVSAPMYCGESASPKYVDTVAVCFQVFLTFGIFTAAALGLAINPAHAVEKDEHLRLRFQVMNVFSGIFAVALIPAACMVREPARVAPEEASLAEPPPTSPLSPGAEMSAIDHSAAVKGQHEQLLYGDGADNTSFSSVAAEDAARGSRRDAGGLTLKEKMAILTKPMVVALFLSAAQQLTGINAIMTYAPQMTEHAGLDPLVGNFLVMLWNFVTSIAAIPISRRVRPRRMYLTGAVVGSCACLVTGIPTYPGVIASEAGRQACVWIGILGFVAVFEMSLGPQFYPLSQAIFPERFRSFGCSFTQSVQFVFNIGINFLYPIAQVQLSGGRSANQNKGQAIIFILFGCLGLSSTAFLIKHMPHPTRVKHVAVSDPNDDDDDDSSSQTPLN